MRAQSGISSRFNFLRMVSTILCLLIPQIGFCSNAKQFKELVDDFSYSMTVTWDQTDKDYAQITETNAVVLGRRRLMEFVRMLHTKKIATLDKVFLFTRQIIYKTTNGLKPL